MCETLRQAVAREPYAQRMGMRCLHLEPGLARVEMTAGPDTANVFGMVHGGAVFSVLDEAFQLACNTHGTVTLALNISVTYVRAAQPGDVLTAEVREVAATARTATYEARVTRGDGELVAVGQTLAYRKSEPLHLSE
ncbi:MAG: hotdog fold thioesterase [Deltaproteobacteria bacterium]|nr:hotdog fold thioesterase [Deltaproteobacteria bacterium]